ncbi:MAG: rhodanese-like domain-containing protein [Candidatus Sericytochromatia bacterium]|nr:rhodanese-like domain-containing protein [Candidatus Sericytochromatia bacterium]
MRRATHLPALGLLTACLLTACQSGGSAPATPATPAAAASPVASASWSPVHVAPLKQRIDAGEPILIVDVRSANAFAFSHIQGAVSLPWSELATGHASLPKDRFIALYCACPDEHTSAGAAQDLATQYGYIKLLVMVGGIGAWQRAGYPVTGQSQ